MFVFWNLRRDAYVFLDERGSGGRESLGAEKLDYEQKTRPKDGHSCDLSVFSRVLKHSLIASCKTF